MKKIIDTLITPPDITLKAAFQKVSESGRKILLITDERKRLIGVVTDSDLRNAIVSGKSLDESITSIMNRDFKAITDQEQNKETKARKMMIEHSIEQIPVLNQDGAVVSLIFWKDFFEKKKIPELENMVLIMAGGKGTRLDPFTKILPKALIPIGDSPIIDLIINQFTQNGFKNIAISVNHKKEMIKNYFFENKHNINIQWVEEETVQGTAGSLKALKGKVEEPFIVTNCDVILKSDYQKILRWHIENKKRMTVVGNYKEVKIPYGVINVNNGNLTKIDEKPEINVLINCGFYILNPDVLEEIPEGVYDMDQLIRKLIKKGDSVGVFPVHSDWFDTGHWDEYKKTIKHFEGLL